MHNGVLRSIKKNKFESLLVRRINLEPVIQSEVSQKEKNKSHILMHTYGIQKNGTHDPACREGMVSCLIEAPISLLAQRLKRLPPVRETSVQSLGWEDSPGEGNGNPLQYSCLENPMDRGAWWATVCGVRQD